VIGPCCLVDSSVELVVCALVRSEGDQRLESNSPLHRNFTVENTGRQHIERPLRDGERVDMLAVLAVEQTEDVHVGTSLRTAQTALAPLGAIPVGAVRAVLIPSHRFESAR
jgi:hypothetical protein